MRKNILRIFSAAVLFATLLMPVSVFNVSAKDNLAKGWSGDAEDSLFIDAADIFSDKKEETLTKVVQDTAEKLELNILILAAGQAQYMSDSQTETYCADTYDDMFGKNTDGIMLFMDFSGKSPAYDYISTSGRAMLDYDSHIDSILDSYWDLMPPSTVSDYGSYGDDIAEAIEVFLSELEYYHGEGDKRIIHDEDKGNYIYIKNGETVVTKSKPLKMMLPALLYAFPIGVIVGFVFFFVAKSHYKFKKPLNPGSYVSRQESNFYRREDRFLRTHTSRTKIQTSSGGGSHSSGHSGGGGSGHSGGSHGGGGRHR